MDPEKWESVDSLTSDSGVMVSNLPLLFAHGYPISLQTMSLKELEAFVPFMVRCSVGEDLKAPWSQLRKPSWWPNKLPFRLPSSRNILVKLVERCYDSHGCQYLLQFCESLQQMQPRDCFRFTDNRDATVSMYHGSTGKLLVTFRVENRDYDQPVTPKYLQPSQKKLLPSPSNHQSGGHGSKSGVMVRPPVTDVFLCDKCDDEFSSLKEVQIHEKHCKGDRPESPKLPSPEPELSDEEEEPDNQVPFLAYFGLQPEKHTGLEPYQSPRKKQFDQDKKFTNPSYLRFEAIDVSSPLGRHILSHSKCGKLQLVQPQVLRYERHVFAAPDSECMSLRERTANRWVVVWRPKREEQNWVHLYCFSSIQRKERLATIRLGLNYRSRKHLSRCKGVKVKLKRLAKRTIDRATRLGGRSAPCIDLTTSEENSPSQLKQANSVAICNQPENTHFSYPIFNPVDYFSQPISHSVFGPCDPDPYGESLIYSDPLELAPHYSNNMLPVNGALVSGPIITAPVKEEPQYITEANPDFMNENPADISDIMSSSGHSSVPSYYDNQTQHTVGINVNNSGNLTKYTVKSEKKIRRSLASSSVSDSSKVSSENTWPTKSNSSVHPSSSCSAKLSRQSDICCKTIEVIDLSSDDEEISEIANRVDSSRRKGYILHNRSFARSKNGYSHWLPEKSLQLSGRKSGDWATNGSALSSVSSQPSSSPYILSSTPKTDPLNGKPIGTLLSSLKVFVMDNINMPDYMSYANSSLYTEWERGKRTKINSIIPRLTLDEEVAVKAPLQIDEDISFNFSRMDCSPQYTLLQRSLSKNYSISSLSPKFGDTVNSGENMFSNLALTVNRGFKYLSSFVKFNVYEEPSIRKDELLSSVPHKNNLISPLSTDHYFCAEGSPDICRNDDVIVSQDSYNKLNKDVEDKPVRKRKRNTRPEIERLMGDECRELHRRGIGILRKVGHHKSKIITRRSLEKVTSTINTRRSKFYSFPSDYLKTKDINSDSQRWTLKHYMDADEKVRLSLTGEHYLNSSRDKFCKEQQLCDINSNVAENRVPCAVTNKVCTLYGEKTNKPTDFDKTRKFDFSVNTVNFYKSQYHFERNITKVAECQSGMTLPQSVCSDDMIKKKPSKISKYKAKRFKLKREVSNLVGDECKELKDLGFHPTDILGHMSLSPSYAHNDSSEFLTPPTSPIRRPSLLMSDRKYSPSKNKYEARMSDMTFSGQESIKNMMQSNKRLSRELSKLMTDEWKELKKSGSHPSQIPGLLSNQRFLRSIRDKSMAPRECRNGSHIGNSKKLMLPITEDVEWTLCRSTRGQAKMSSVVELETARTMHRNLLQAETAMCVVNYDVPK